MYVCIETQHSKQFYVSFKSHARRCMCVISFQAYTLIFLVSKISARKSSIYFYCKSCKCRSENFDLLAEVSFSTEVIMRNV